MAECTDRDAGSADVISDIVSYVHRLLVRLFQLSALGLVLLLFSAAARSYGEELLLTALGIAMLVAGYDVFVMGREFDEH